MEAINNLAQTAAKAVWGENETKKEEPLSGVSGDTSKGEPYDAGNMDQAEQKAIVNQSNGGGDNISRQPDTSHPKDAVASQSKSDGDNTSGQNDTRNPEDAATDPAPEHQDVTTADSGPTNKGLNLDNTAPKPLETLAKEHGGDAGNIGREDDSSTRPHSDSSPDEDQEHPKHETNEGTGEQYIKSSGLKADGGDFDASKPGAGREADRLLGEKGMENPTEKAAAGPPDTSTESSTPAGGQEEGGKPGFRERIKQKLHRP